MTERSTRVGLGFGLSVLIARSLGPDLFGLYSYALSVVAIFAFLGQAGLDGLLLRELVRKPEEASIVLSQGIALRLAGAVLAGLASLATAGLAATEALRPSVPLVGIMVFSGIFQAGWVVESLLQGRGLFAAPAKAKIGTYLVSAFLRALALLSPVPLLLLAMVMVLESALCTLLLWRASRGALGIGFTALKVPLTRDVAALSRLAAPMLLSAFTVALYSRIDVFMVGRMIDSTAAGIYTAGSLLSEGFYLLPVSIMTAVAPRMALLFIEDRSAFAESLHSFLRMLSAIGLAVALTVTVSAHILVDSLFGAAYRDAVEVLQVHIWSTWAVFIGTASDPWYINYDLRRLYLFKTTTAALVNILLNFMMIPKFGVTGAAWATLVAYVASAVVFGAFWPDTRALFWMQIRACCGMRFRAPVGRRG